VAAARQHPRPVGDIEVLQQVAALGIEHLRADRHLQRDVAARLAAAVGAFAAGAAARFEDFLESEIEERVEVGVGDQEDVAARAAVAAVGPAARDELLAAKAQRALAAVSGRDMDFDFVYKHGDRL